VSQQAISHEQAISRVNDSLHLQAIKARIGIPRAYGYGATMGARAVDYLGFWAGNSGMVRHSKMQFRGPSFEGDVTYVDGEVTAKEAESAFGVPLIGVKVRMTNQDAVVLVDGVAELELPLD
jgi:hypothetical protein